MKLDSGYVYILFSELGYKIGITSRTPQQRLQEFSHLPFKVDLLFFCYCRNYRFVEKDLHRLYNKFRINGEWFELTEDDYENIKRFILKYELL